MTDAELLELVSAAFRAAEPVPDAVSAAARTALGRRVPGAVRARLVSDDDLRPAPALRGPAPRLLTFDGGGRTVEVELTPTGQVYEIAGRLLPRTAAQVRVRHTDGEIAGQVGPGGRFVVDGVPPGLVSLLFRLPDGASVVTGWVRL
ncbi:hypothetical protein [Thermomonospora amylolytica]|uniref:hypothetical protein n=1 Tax=Thermomonospora amylolytica TaxID=1411117 RepID=UPI000E6C6AE3|nr:hypothetical protein [Thermomonospora amylolytica]